MTKVVVITGGSAGVGKATALYFAKKGYSIAILARNQERLECTKKETEQFGVKVLTISLDVASADEVDEAAELIEKNLGPIDVWINNAMVSVFSPVSEMSPLEFERVTKVTYLGVVYGTLSALKRMKKRDKGIIIQVGSALAYRSIPLQSAYCAAKHAVQGFTESVRCELIHNKSHVKISMVQLPALNTPQFNWVKTRLPRKPQPVPPIYQPEVAAEAIFKAAHHYRREWYVGRSTLLAIIGNKLFPSFADWYLGKTGYEAQQYNGSIEQNRPDNLFEPVIGNYGVHGDFDERAISYSLQALLSRNRLILLVAVIIILIILL